MKQKQRVIATFEWVLATIEQVLATFVQPRPLARVGIAIEHLLAKSAFAVESGRLLATSGSGFEHLLAMVDFEHLLAMSEFGFVVATSGSAWPAVATEFALIVALGLDYYLEKCR